MIKKKVIVILLLMLLLVYSIAIYFDAESNRCTVYYGVEIIPLYESSNTFEYGNRNTTECRSWSDAIMQSLYDSLINYRIFQQR